MIDEHAVPAGSADGERGPRRTDTRDPHHARARALKILFQADIRGVSPDVTLARLTDEPAAREILDAVDDLSSGAALLPPVVEDGTEIELVSSDRGGPAPGQRGAAARAAREADSGGDLDVFTRTLVAGVHEDRARIDALITRFARRWQISRMPVVDRTVLRLATYELIHEDTSPAIVIDEAVGLAKALSTDDSGRYVNGVLESIRRELAANPVAREIPAEPDGAGETEALLDLAEGRAPADPAADSPEDSAPPAADSPEAPAAPEVPAADSPEDPSGSGPAVPEADAPNSDEDPRSDEASVPPEAAAEPLTPGVPEAPAESDVPADLRPADQPSLFT